MSLALRGVPKPLCFTHSLNDTRHTQLQNSGSQLLVAVEQEAGKGLDTHKFAHEDAVRGGLKTPMAKNEFFNVHHMKKVLVYMLISTRKCNLKQEKIQMLHTDPSPRFQLSSNPVQPAGE